MKASLLGNSAAHGFKDFEYPWPKPEGVFRIFVLGDSIPFGQGVRLDETFSKVLEGILNRTSTTRVYEVLNSAVPGMNAVQEYCLQRTLGVHYQPDLYLLGLCHNDPEFFQPEDDANYEEHLRKIWDRNGEAWPYFLESLKRMKSLAEAHGSRLVVAYFVFHLTSVAPEVPRILRETCDELGLPFTDVGESTRQHPAESLWVNQTETHPNETGHQIIAQHLARFLRQEGFLPSEDPALDERDVLRKLLTAYESPGGGPWRQAASVPLTRMHSLLQAKLKRPPTRKPEDGRASKEEIEQALARLSPVLRSAQIAECLDGYDTYLRLACFQDHVGLFLLKQMLTELAISVYYLSMMSRLRALITDMVPYATSDPPAPNPDAFQGAAATLASTVRRIASFKADLTRICENVLNPSGPPGAVESFLDPALPELAGQLRLGLQAPQRPFALLIEEAHRAGLALTDLGEELAVELETHGKLSADDFPEPQQFQRYRHFLGETLDFYVTAVKHLCFSLDDVNLEGLATAATALAEGTAKPWAGRRVDLEVTANVPPTKEYRGLGIFWTNVVPLSAPQRDTLAVQKDHKDHSYHFRFFVGVLGYFTVELNNCEIGQIRSIRLRFNDKLCREWTGEDLQALAQNRLRSELLMMVESE